MQPTSYNEICNYYICLLLMLMLMLYTGIPPCLIYRIIVWADITERNACR